MHFIPSNPIIEIPYTITNDGIFKEPQATVFLVRSALFDWREFTLSIYKLIKGRIDTEFSRALTQFYIPPIQTEREKELMNSYASKYLDQAREIMRSGNYFYAMTFMTSIKRLYLDIGRPSQRWYNHGNFAVISNIATCALKEGFWNIARIGIRYTLQMKPDHQRSYTNLHQIATAFKANQLIDEFKEIAKDVTEKSQRSFNEWRNLANKVIGLTSLKAFSYAIVNKLTDDIRKEVIETGIDDLYSSISVDSSLLPVLPYLKSTDIEPLLPDI